MVNTGWSGGPYGVGKRMKLSYTRAMVSAAIKGNFEDNQFVEHPIFKVLVPKNCPNVPEEILNPENTWDSKEEYFKMANELAEKFNENFKKFKNVSEEIRNAAPAAAR